MSESIRNNYVFGMDGAVYLSGPDMLNGRLLIHPTRGTRIFITGCRYVNQYICWETRKEYPPIPKYYAIDSVLLTDIELDQCPKWKSRAVLISKDNYEYLRSGTEEKRGNNKLCTGIL